MTRRRIRFLIALLLPLMVLRALLPAGYMPVAGNDGLRIVMCSAGLATTTTGDATDRGDHPGLAGGEGCVFAHAAVAAPPPVQGVPAVRVAAGTSPDTPAESFVISTLLRSQSARAPPALSA